MADNFFDECFDNFFDQLFDELFDEFFDEYFDKFFDEFLMNFFDEFFNFLLIAYPVKAVGAVSELNLAAAPSFIHCYFILAATNLL